MFSWDVRKAQTNYDKHGVAFEEAATVFADPAALDWEDVAHSGKEGRASASADLRPTGFCLWCTPSGRGIDEQETVRIISARQASRKERKAYAGQPH